MSEVNCTLSGVRFVDLDGIRWFVAKDVLLSLGIIHPPKDRPKDYLRFIGAAHDHEQTVYVGRARTHVVSEEGAKRIIERWVKKDDPRRTNWLAQQLEGAMKVSGLVGEMMPSVSLQAQYRSARDRLVAQADDLRKRLERIEGDLAVLDRAEQIMAMEIADAKHGSVKAAQRPMT